MFRYSKSTPASNSQFTLSSIACCCHVWSLNSACPENTYLVVVQYSPQYKIECVECPENSTSQRGIGKICPCIEGFGRIKEGNASSPCVGECPYIFAIEPLLSVSGNSIHVYTACTYNSSVSSSLVVFFVYVYVCTFRPAPWHCMLHCIH